MNTSVKSQVVSQQYGVRWKYDVLNVDGTVWRRAGEVEPVPNFSTAKALICSYRRQRWTVELVLRELVYTNWKIRG